jgi:BolA protein
MSVAEKIQARLEATLAPIEFEIVDQSHEHRGHAGWREAGETHFHMHLVSAAFTGQTRLARQRMVHKALGDLLKETIHALSMELRAPGED